MKDCNQCGKCCTKYSDGGLTATLSEIRHWAEFRPEISEFVTKNEIWMHPDTGEQIALCPWLRKLPGQKKYTCDIYYDRPEDCRQYPSTIQQMIEDECEMLEQKDRIKPKHAQKHLDRMMLDSGSAWSSSSE